MIFISIVNGHFTIISVTSIHRRFIDIRVDKKRRGFHRNCERIDILSFEILFAMGLSVRLALPENWLMRFFRCRGLTCEWQTAARGSVGRCENRTSRSPREIGPRWFPQFRGRGQERIEVFGRAGIIWPCRFETRGYEGSYKIIPSSTAPHLQWIRRCWEL